LKIRRKREKTEKRDYDRVGKSVSGASGGVEVDEIYLGCQVGGEKQPRERHSVKNRLFLEERPTARSGRPGA